MVTAKREKQSHLEMEDYASRMGTDQELSTTDDLVGFQTEHSTKATGLGKGIQTFSDTPVGLLQSNYVSVYTINTEILAIR